ncbi:glycerophosphodiester phosphodiesterase [Massilia sp. TS11]|uniref:glycerophosphodiester phosphodiesterase n=1 Tax=Massilia sp. TS11 TaxID=2908003 RepID=UPI001EDB9E19|nr:glycerophosphodiester phosphodiesterase [Massilia sp. TS11]MCG2585680.1 glycerophosphodiester phosphodiesterase [Massilia sp. TS11]
MWPYPRILAHRGGGSLAPENTLAALRTGLAHGFRAVEFDVMLTRDGVGVVLHDPELGRTVAGSGSVAALSAAELTRMDAGRWFSPAFAGEPVPLFTQFVQFCQEHGIWMNIELKPVPGFEAETGRLIANVTRALFTDALASGEPRRLPLFSSFSMTALAAAAAAAPDLPRACLFETLDGDWLDAVRRVGAIAIDTDYRHLQPGQIRAVKAAGLGLFCYTVNDPAIARSLLAAGVDGLCTDAIDRIGPEFPL